MMHRQHTLKSAYKYYYKYLQAPMYNGILQHIVLLW